MHERGIGAELGNNDGDTFAAGVLEQHHTSVQALAVADGPFPFGAVAEERGTRRRGDVGAREASAESRCGWNYRGRRGVTGVQADASSEKNAKDQHRKYAHSCAKVERR